MEDVVLHYQPGSAVGLSSLLERTEKLLESFPCRTPPVFTPWFPDAAADLHLPIRPAKPAPVITGTDIHTAQNKPQKPDANGLVDRPPAETPPENPQDGVGVSGTPKCLLPERQVTRLPPENTDGLLVTHSPVKRSWSVFTQKGVLLPSSQSLSKQFHHMVSVHRLHLHQRAKWVISQHNCGAARDIEQVWRALSRSVQSSRLPTCNANIQREWAEIWVFCDVVHCERVGRLLKDELQLLGRIGLSVRRLGNIFSM